MVNIKSNHIHLVASAFFAICLAVHAVGFYYDGQFPVIFLFIDFGLSLLFLIIYKVRIVKVEFTMAVILLLWALYIMVSIPEDQATHCFIYAYASMIIYKISKRKYFTIFVLVALLVTTHSLSLLLNNISPLKTLLNMFLIVAFSTLHYFIYYKEYKQQMELHELRITDQEVRIIEQLGIKDPSNKRIADNLNMSESDVKAKLGKIYTKFNIISGGSKKTELVAKLARLGFVH